MSDQADTSRESHETSFLYLKSYTGLVYTVYLLVLFSSVTTSIYARHIRLLDLPVKIELDNVISHSDVDSTS